MSSRDLDTTEDAELRVARANEAAKQKAKQYENDLKWLMAHKPGRRIMARLLEITGVYRTSFTGNSETFFREGERNVGLKFLNDLLTATPEAYVQLLKESKE